MRDLDWIGGGFFTLAIQDAALMLSGEEEASAPDLLRLLAGVAAEWNGGVQLTDSLHRPPTPFHVLLHAVPADADRLQRLLDAAGLAAPGAGRDPLGGSGWG